MKPAAIGQHLMPDLCGRGHKARVPHFAVISTILTACRLGKKLGCRITPFARYDFSSGHWSTGWFTNAATLQPIHLVSPPKQGPFTGICQQFLKKTIPAAKYVFDFAWAEVRYAKRSRPTYYNEVADAYSLYSRSRCQRLLLTSAVCVKFL